VGFNFLQKKQREKGKYSSHKVFRAREEEGEFYTLFGSVKDDMGVSKCENLKQLLHTDNDKKNTRWRRSIRTEERLVLTLRLFNKNV
jgi:hypothetical protein